MRPIEFVEALGALEFQNTFNPYADRCPVHDFVDAPDRRSKTLSAMLKPAVDSDIDAIWIGRDLGYRGGRRTGLALTDDVHIYEHAKRWGISVERPTKGLAVAERTAAVIWGALSQIEASVFLWNVFPYHPHDPGDPFTNRAHNSRERNAGEGILSQLMLILRPRRLVAIGNEAARTAYRLADKCVSIKVRHPSYGGQTQFLRGIREVYNLPEGTNVHPADDSNSDRR